MEHLAGVLDLGAGPELTLADEMDVGYRALDHDAGFTDNATGSGLLDLDSWRHAVSDHLEGPAWMLVEGWKCN
jgi:hypothetical protein